MSSSSQRLYSMLETQNELFVLNALLTPADFAATIPSIISMQQGLLRDLGEFDRADVTASAGWSAYNLGPHSPATHDQPGWYAFLDAWCTNFNQLILGMVNNGAEPTAKRVSVVAYSAGDMPVAIASTVDVNVVSPVHVNVDNTVTVTPSDPGADFFGLRLFPKPT